MLLELWLEGVEWLRNLCILKVTLRELSKILREPMLMHLVLPKGRKRKWDNCIFTPSWFLPTGFALTFRACSVLPLLFPSRSLECPLTVWPKLWKFITNSYELRKMQIRYQNVQINITFMCISFAFRTKAPFKLPEVINVINIIKNKKV